MRGLTLAVSLVLLAVLAWGLLPARRGDVPEVRAVDRSPTADDAFVRARPAPPVAAEPEPSHETRIAETAETGKAAPEPAGAIAPWTIEVVDGSGHAVTGARVQVTIELRSDGVYRIDRQLDGVATLEIDVGEMDGRPAVVRAWAPSYRATSRDFVSADSGDVTTVTLVPGCGVFGRVVDRFGAPVPSASVTLHGIETEGKGPHWATDRSDDRGRFAVGTIASGAGMLRVHRDQVGGNTLRLELTHRGHLDVGDVVLTGSGEVRGRVVLSDGTPARGVPLRIERAVVWSTSPGVPRAWTKTDEDGAFHFTALADGDFFLGHQIGHVPQFDEEKWSLARDEWPRYPSGTTDVRLALKAAKLTISVAGGAAIDQLTALNLTSGARLFTTHFGSGRSAGRRSVEVFVESGLSYRFTAQGGDDRWFEATVDVPDPSGEMGVELHPLTELAALDLTLTGPAGERITDFRVDLESLRGDGWTNRSAPGDQNEGRFEGLPPGRHRMVVWPRVDGQALMVVGDREIELVPGEVTRERVDAILGGSVDVDLTGIAADHDGQGATVRARRAGDPEEAMKALSLFREDGEYRIHAAQPDPGEIWSSYHPMEPGPWIVRVELPGYRPFETTVTVRAGEATPVAVTLERE